jgi:hypothetical protein
LFADAGGAMQQQAGGKCAPAKGAEEPLAERGVAIERNDRHVRKMSGEWIVGQSASARIVTHPTRAPGKRGIVEKPMREAIWLAFQQKVLDNCKPAGYAPPWPP